MNRFLSQQQQKQNKHNKCYICTYIQYYNKNSKPASSGFEEIEKTQDNGKEYLISYYEKRHS